MFKAIGTGSTLWKGQALQLPWGELLYEGNSVKLHSGSCEMSSALDPDRGPFLEVHWTSSYFVAASAAGDELYLGTRDKRNIEQIATLVRWSETQSFSPGIHAVRFFDIDEGSSVVAHELGIGVVTSEKGLVWNVTHGDISNRVLSVDANHIQMMGLNMETWFTTADGTSRERPVKKAPQ